MNPQSAEEWEREDESNRTGERLVVRPNEPPSEPEPTTLHDELRTPQAAPDSDALPTQPDHEAPQAPTKTIIESYVDEIGADSDDFRDTIPAPVPVDES
jgi:hypothetical protein